METDISRIEESILKENYLVMLGFSGGNYVPLRVIARDRLQYYVYDPINEGSLSAPIAPAGSTNGITNNTFIQPFLFSSSNVPGKPQNVFRVTNNNELYQIFWGVAPSVTRVFVDSPFPTQQGAMDFYNWTGAYNQFGWIDGFDSPMKHPSKRSEMIIPYNFDVAFGFANPVPISLSPMFMFVVNRIKVGLVTDVSLISLMLQRKVITAYYTVGGLTDYNYPIQSTFGIPPITLTDTPAQIATKIAQAR